jgi:HAD superfamily hydrolase (TIGR01509 family)
MIKETKCVIFDMDGVIIDSEAIHKKAYYETFKSLGIQISDDLYASITGSSTLNTFEKLVVLFHLKQAPNDLVLEKRKRYIAYFQSDPNLHLVEGVREIIEYFYNKGITLVLASSSAMVNIERVFNRFDLNKYFTAKISGADLKASKPHPEIFEKAAILSGFPKENCVVIEDSDNGIKAANDAGIFVFGYQNPLAENQTLQNANAVISKFNLLKAYI